MKIIYRISPFKPDNPAVVFAGDKWGLVNFCHNSFLRAKRNRYCETTYILDSCDWDFSKYGKQININPHNKQDSLLTAYDVAMTLDDNVLFVEDDYLWRDDTISLIDYAVMILGVLSPYDHPAHYIEERFSKQFELKLIGNEVYRTCPSNTHTFAIRKDILKENIEMMKKYGANDHGMFSELNKTHQLWCPTHSFATHLAKGCLAPNVLWPLS